MITVLIVPTQNRYASRRQATLLLPTGFPALVLQPSRIRLRSRPCLRPLAARYREELAVLFSADFSSEQGCISLSLLTPSYVAEIVIVPCKKPMAGLVLFTVNVRRYAHGDRSSANPT